jgi:DNA polymerase IIIc chi subunit
MTSTDTQIWTYEYQPYVAHDPREEGIHPDPELDPVEREIPCFRIYPEDRPEEYIAETNEHLPRDLQKRYARLIAAAPALLEAAQLVLERWCEGDLAEAVRMLDGAVAEATGGQP